MAVLFNRRFKHGKADFHPGVLYGFEDPDAAPYFIAVGVASADAGEPAVIFAQGEVDIDPLTTFGFGENKGAPVLPALAAQAEGSAS